MATFSIGQRVRVVGRLRAAIDFHEVPMGAEGVIFDTAEAWEWLVHIPGHRHSIGPGQFPADCWGFNSEHLAPILDERAAAFIEAVKSWKPEPVIPLPVKERINQFHVLEKP